MKSITRIAMLLIVLLMALALPATALAQDGGNGKVVFGGTYTLESGQTLNGSLAVFGGEATLEENSIVNGDIALSGGTLTINGLVNGDVAILGGTVMIGETAHVRGDITTLGGSVNRSPGAKVDGSVTNGPSNFSFNLPRSFVAVPTIPRINFDPIGRAMWAIFQALALGAIAVLVGMFLPNPTKRVAATIATQPVVSGGIGLLTVFILPVVVVLLAITILLIPVSLLGILAAVIAVTFGWIALGLEVGERMATSLFHQDWTTPVAAGVGTFTLSLVANMVSIVPCIGWLLPFLITIVAVGGVLASRFGTQIYAPATVPMPPAQYQPQTTSYPVPTTPPMPPAPPDDASDHSSDL
jgi:hypothetical protein